MNDQEVREIVEAAFHAHFDDMKVVRVNIRRGFDHEDDPVVDVTVIYDGKFEQLTGNRILNMRLDVNHKICRDAEDSPGWPLVHFMPKSSVGRRDPAKVFFGPAPYSR